MPEYCEIKIGGYLDARWSDWFGGLSMTYLEGNFTFYLIAMGFGAAAFGKRFRLYSIITLVVSFTGGLVTGLYVPALVANQPTPGMGVWERINIFSYLLWAIVLAIGLMRSQPGPLTVADRERIHPPEAAADRA